MNKFHFFFLIFPLIFFTSCSDKTSVEYFTKNTTTAYAIQYTKKRDIIVNNEVKVMIFSTFLNKINSKYESEKLDSFIIGIHYVNVDDSDLIANRFELTLNDEKPVNMVKLKKDSDFLKNISLKNKWATYYLIHFKKDDNKTLTLTLTHPVWGSTTLNFDR